MTFDKVNFDVNQVADTAIQIKLLPAEEKGLTLKHLVDSSSNTKVVGDPYRLNQILLNLLSNAIKFTHEGEVVLSHRVNKIVDDTVWIQFTVKDTGIGIPKNRHDEIFKSFTQLNPIYQNTTAGLGLEIGRAHV